MSLLLQPPLPPLPTTTTIPTRPQQYNTPTTNINNNTSSIMIVIIIIASAIILSASIYLLLRLLSRRFRSTFSPNDVVSLSSHHHHHHPPYINHHDDNNNTQHVSSNDLSDSLPLFTFSSLTGTLTGSADCAVCLSKFQPQDHLRLLPLCCHAFHSQCIDTWLSNNHTCPLCRSSVHPSHSELLNKILSVSQNNNNSNNDNSFRIEIGSVSRRRGTNSDTNDGRRSYSIGSFDYIVDEAAHEVSVQSTTHVRGGSVDKESTVMDPENLAAEVASGGRSWLREYVDRLSFVSMSSRATSFRSSGRFFTGSSRRSEVVVPVEDLEANRVGEEISELFRWLSGV